MPRKKRSYDDKFRASAVIMLQAQGYPDTKGALQTVSKYLAVPASTLQGWYNATSNPPPTDIRYEKTIDLIQSIKDEIAGIIGTLPGKRDEASYKDLSTSLGIFVDKLQLLENKPTEISEQRHSGDIKLTATERNSRLAEILDSARSRRSGLPANGERDTNVH